METINVYLCLKKRFKHAFRPSRIAKLGLWMSPLLSNAWADVLYPLHTAFPNLQPYVGIINNYLAENEVLGAWGSKAGLISSLMSTGADEPCVLMQAEYRAQLERPAEALSYRDYAPVTDSEVGIFGQYRLFRNILGRAGIFFSSPRGPLKCFQMRDFEPLVGVSAQWFDEKLELLIGFQFDHLGKAMNLNHIDPDGLCNVPIYSMQLERCWPDATEKSGGNWIAKQFAGVMCEGCVVTTRSGLGSLSSQFLVEKRLKAGVFWHLFDRNLFCKLLIQCDLLQLLNSHNSARDAWGFLGLFSFRIDTPQTKPDLNCLQPVNRRSFGAATLRLSGPDQLQGAKVTLDDIILDSKTKSKFERILEQIRTGNGGPVRVVVHGKAGVGKSLLAGVCANIPNTEVKPWHPDQFKTAQEFIEGLEGLKQRAAWGYKEIVVLDEGEKILAKSVSNPVVKAACQSKAPEVAAKVSIGLALEAANKLSGDQETKVNHFLTFLDGLNKNDDALKRIHFIITTNFIDEMDPRLLRGAGRFELIEIDRPRRSQLEELAKNFLFKEAQVRQGVPKYTLQLENQKQFSEKYKKAVVDGLLARYDTLKQFQNNYDDMLDAWGTHQRQEPLEPLVGADMQTVVKDCVFWLHREFGEALIDEQTRPDHSVEEALKDFLGDKRLGVPRRNENFVKVGKNKEEAILQEVLAQLSNPSVVSQLSSNPSITELMKVLPASSYSSFKSLLSNPTKLLNDPLFGQIMQKLPDPLVEDLCVYFPFLQSFTP